MSEVLRFQTEVRSLTFSPLRRAAASALIYVVLCSVYIVVSGRLALSSVTTMAELMAVETVKGLVFVAISGLLYFAVSLVRWNRIWKQEKMIMVQEKALLLAEKRALAGMFAATIAHDLNNLLMSLSGLIELMKARKQDQFLVKMTERLENGAASLTLLAKRVSYAARQGIPEVEAEVDLAEILQRLVALVRRHPDLRETTVELTDLSELRLHLKGALLESALLNLFVNAGQAAGPGGRVSIRLRSDGSAVSIEVHDSGPGIPSDQVEAIFDPCYTTKSNGTGVGLLAVKAFAASCNGEVVVERSDLGGAAFAIRIPEKSAKKKAVLLMSN